MLYSMSSDKNDTRTKILEATWKLLEEHRGQGASMGQIAREAGISRQAVYLHFASRTELIIATTLYVDEVKGLDARFDRFREAETGIAKLEACIDVWGNYIPEIIGMAKTLLATRETDEATAAAWDEVMGCLRDVCRETIDVLAEEGNLAPEWSRGEATDLFMAMISVNAWEELTVESGWTNAEYVERMKKLLKRALISNSS